MNRLVLLLIVLVACTLRMAVLASGYHAGGSGLLTPDSDDYLRTANTLAWNGRFATTPDAPAELVRTPGYPLLLAAMARLTGQPPVVEIAGQTVAMPSALRLTLTVQVLLDCALVVITYLLGVQLCRTAGRAQTVGLLAAALQATSAVAIAASVRVLSDSLFALLLTSALLCLVIALRTRKWSALLGGAVLLAGATYVRPIGLLLPIPIVILLLASRRSLMRSAAFAAVFVACVAPWVVRNSLAGGYPHFSAIQAVNLYEYNAVAVRAHLANKPEDAMRLQARLEVLVHTDPDQPAQQYRWEARQGLSVVAAHPLLYTYLHLRSDVHNLLPGITDVLEAAGLTTGQRGTTDVLKREGLPAAVRHYFGDNRLALTLAIPSLVLLIVLYAGVALGAIMNLRLHMPAELWLILLMILYFLLVPGPQSHPRFRTPVEPLLSIVAAAGIAQLFRRHAEGTGEKSPQIHTDDTDSEADRR